ncbi:MAG: hypothetical protein JWQ71_5014 [Pedosphaera sp.]|nr:hypothetical protein [Pedosphaera sp.]
MKAFMRVLVQDTKTQLYLGRAASWTPDFNQAVNFEHTLKAFNYLGVSQMKDAQIVMKFEDGQYDIRLNPPQQRMAFSLRAY